MQNNKSRVKQTAKNIVVGFLYKFIMLILAFISRKIFIDYIGIGFLGINSLFSNVLSILCLADLGIGVAMTYALYKPLSDNDEEKICALINYFKKIYNNICLFIFLLGLLSIPFLKYIVNLENEIDGLYVFYILFVVKTCASYVFVYKSTLLIADQKNYINNLITMCTNAIKVLSQILVIIIFKNYYIYIIIDIVFTLITNIMLNLYTNKEYPFLKQEYSLEKVEKKKLFKNMKSVFLYKISAVIINSTDNIIISFLVGTVVLGYYSNYYVIVDQLSPILTIIFGSLTASVGNLLISNSDEKKYEIFKISTVVSNYLGIVMSLGFLMLAQDFIRLWLGSTYLLDYSLVIAMTLNLLYSCINQPIWTYREAGGLYIKTKYIMLYTAMLNIALSIILGICFGISGIIAATFISKLCICFWYEPKILYNDYFNKKATSFFVMCLKQLVTFAICSVICYLLTQNIYCNSWLFFIAKGLIIVAVSSSIYVLLNIKNKEFNIMIQYFKKLLKRRNNEKSIKYSN